MLRSFRRLCSRLRWPRRRRRSRARVVVIKKFGKSTSKTHVDGSSASAVHPNAQFLHKRTIRIATFNAASFSMAPAVDSCGGGSLDSSKSGNDRPPKSILKQSSSLGKAKARARVSINLPDNEISLVRNGEASVACWNGIGRRGTAVVEVLRELDADILALQDVKAEEERGMSPLSDLARALGMKYYVFADSWAPQYGNALLSRWPIKHWKVHKIKDDTDFRNVLKATIDVGEVGEVNVQCTHLDHLDENWRMKQIQSIIRSTDTNEPHILLGGLNSLDPTDYSQQRWTDILKYYEEIGKPTPEAKVIKFLKSSIQYRDAKEYGGECESVVMVAKGQSVQGTCKYGTRVDYILASPNADYQFVQGSYSVLSSKGTSDHHIVKVDFFKSPTQPHSHSHSPSPSPWKKWII